MIVPIRLDFKTVFKIDDLFRRGDLLLDKSTDTVFFYRPEAHKETIFQNPNNYRIAHKGDMYNVRLTFKQKILTYYYRLKYKLKKLISKA